MSRELGDLLRVLRREHLLHSVELRACSSVCACGAAVFFFFVAGSPPPHHPASPSCFFFFFSSFFFVGGRAAVRVAARRFQPLDERGLPTANFQTGVAQPILELRDRQRSEVHFWARRCEQHRRAACVRRAPRDLKPGGANEHEQQRSHLGAEMDFLKACEREDLKMEQVGLADMSELEVAGTDVAGLGDVGDWFDAVEDEPDEPPAAVTVASKTYLRTVASSDTKSSICLFAGGCGGRARRGVPTARAARWSRGAHPRPARPPPRRSSRATAGARRRHGLSRVGAARQHAENFARNPPARAGGAGDAGDAGTRVRVLGHLWGAPSGRCSPRPAAAPMS